jgi:hypothetical protein
MQPAIQLFPCGILGNCSLFPSDIFQLNSCSDITLSAFCLFCNLTQIKSNGICSGEHGGQEIGSSVSQKIFFFQSGQPVIAGVNY